MDVRRILSDIDAEIAKLQQIKASLSGLATSSVASSTAGTGRRGRPKGSKNTPKAAKAAKTAAPAKTKRKLSPEGRKAIADAMKRRWAERRKEAGK